MEFNPERAINFLCCGRDIVQRQDYWFAHLITWCLCVGGEVDDFVLEKPNPDWVDITFCSLTQKTDPESVCG